MELLRWFVLTVVLVGLTNFVSCELQVGAGIGDVTGAAGEVTMMGYAKSSQKSHGIHIRLFSRAFVFKDSNGNSAVYVSVDVGMISQVVRTQVVKNLEAKFGGLYNEKNILLSGTHTHSSPGGFLQYMLYSIATLGFCENTFHAQVNGIVLSIERAHSNLQPASVFYNEGKLFNSNINRSPSSYLDNPKDERDKYSDGDTDKSMKLIKIVSKTGSKPLGMVNWFPVHGTSMNNTNLLISGDNKGLASQMVERSFEPDSLPGKNKFVAAFGQANEGDVSPNTKGARCIDTGEPCDVLTSACGKSVKKCIAFGPGRDMEESAMIIGTSQANRAKELYEEATESLSDDSVSFIHQNIDMSQYSVNLEDGSTVKTCPPAMGFSFAAGTTDGPGEFNFLQGDTTGNKLWDIIRSFLSKPTQAQKDCHSPKPILLNTGFVKFPTPWQPSVVETQILRVGNLYIIGLPGEFTTMSGRRIEKAMSDILVGKGIKNAKIVLAGLSNVYTSYIATYEEYQSQRYEAASTIFGPHTLSAYIQQFKILMNALNDKVSLPPGPSPPFLLNTAKKWSFITPVVVDSAGINKNMGDVLHQPAPSYSQSQTVEVKFISGHPRNRQLLEKTFLTVERQVGNNWKVVCTDANLETKFQWVRTNVVLGRSEAHISWNIPHCVKSGTHRIRHFGYWKPMFKSPEPYQGTTNTFTISNTKATKFWDRQLVMSSYQGCGCV